MPPQGLEPLAGRKDNITVWKRMGMNGKLTRRVMY